MNIQNNEAMLADPSTRAILANPRFRQLTRSRSALGWTLAAIMWVVYFGFILLVAFNKVDGAILSAKISPGAATSVAIVAGFGILVMTFIITAIYVAIANARFDRLTAELLAEVGR